MTIPQIMAEIARLDPSYLCTKRMVQRHSEDYRLELWKRDPAVSITCNADGTNLRDFGYVCEALGEMAAYIPNLMYVVFGPFPAWHFTGHPGDGTCVDIDASTPEEAVLRAHHAHLVEKEGEK